MDDALKEDRFGTKLKRYGQVSGAVAGLAMKLAGERYFGQNIERDGHAAELMEILSNLKNPLMKVGQILSTIPEALPEEYADAFTPAANVPMGWSFVRRRMSGA